MTGMGNDGSKGCLHIETAGGTILVEDPRTAVAPSMPRELIKIVKNHTVYDSKEMGKAIVKAANSITEKLQKAKTK
jgi:chemotaxis response regulator CheB